MREGGLVGFWGGHQKKSAFKGGPCKKNKGKGGGHVKYFSITLTWDVFYYFLKKIYPHRNKQRKFLNLLETFLLLLITFPQQQTTILATKLKVIPQYCIANPYCARFLRHWCPQMSACTFTMKEISLKLSLITK